MNIDARCGGFAFPFFSLAGLLLHYERVHHSRWGAAARAAPRRSVPIFSNNRLLLRSRGGPLRAALALRRFAAFQHCQTIVCCCATGGDRCARCAASQRSRIFKQSFVAAQPWGTAARASRAAPRRNVPTLSNIQTIVCCCATGGDRCARCARTGRDGHARLKLLL